MVCALHGENPLYSLFGHNEMKTKGHNAAEAATQVRSIFVRIKPYGLVFFVFNNNNNNNHHDADFFFVFVWSSSAEGIPREAIQNGKKKRSCSEVGKCGPNRMPEMA
ncbi:hypothetical protein Scep_007741 [Stephania cephalantha]|uniref:Uncharacterized protein n=1 Tax=Stephania cephalantha TaxID=152367 RepID=A0AAP0KCE9_9MAGN